MSRPLDRLRFHVSGAIARGEAVPIVGIPVPPGPKGEPCGAADCQGAPWPGDDDEGPEDPALDIEEGDGRTPRERLGLGGGE